MPLFAPGEDKEQVRAERVRLLRAGGGRRLEEEPSCCVLKELASCVLHAAGLRGDRELRAAGLRARRGSCASGQRVSQTECRSLAGGEHY
jgi:hypothetical protein